jgi:hypothetical protein
MNRNDKKWGFGGGLGYGGKEGKWGNGGDLTADGGWWRCRDAGDGVSVMVGRCFGGVFWMLGRKENGDGGGECMAQEKEMRGKKNSDLKIGHVRPKNECVRTYMSAFDRIRAECMCNRWALCSNVKGTFERIRASMCVCDGALRSNTCK